MGAPTREVGTDPRGPAMKTLIDRRRENWRSLTSQDKQQRLQTMRQRQQRHVEFEMLRLHAHVR